VKDAEGSNRVERDNRADPDVGSHFGAIEEVRHGVLLAAAGWSAVPS